MPTPDFRFEVSAAFTITGRGTAVIGRLVAGNMTSGEPLFLLAGGRVTLVAEAHVEMMLKQGSEELALTLQGVTADQVTPGAVLLAHARPAE